MENIEAMLCAYIEGDLDEAGRKEIEKHLAEHPQHRKMLEDLIAQRQLLRDLPRVKAPGDVGEGLRGQVERSILLGSPDSMKLERPARGFRLPQYITAAAILLLGASLVLIVYRTVVPTFKPANYTQVAPSAVDQKTQSEIEADIEASKAQNAPMAAATPATQPSPSEVAAAPAPMLSFRAAQFEGVPPAPVDMSAIRDELKSSGYDLSKPAVGKSTPLVFVVGVPDTAVAGRQISQFLSTQNGISWWEVPQGGATQPSARQQLAQAATLPSAQQLSGAYSEKIAQRIYVACNMNPQQAAALQEALNDQPPEAVPTYELYGDSVRATAAGSAGGPGGAAGGGISGTAATEASTEPTTEATSEPTTGPSGPDLVDAIIVVRAASTVVPPELQTQPTTEPMPRMPPGATTAPSSRR